MNNLEKMNRHETMAYIQEHFSYGGETLRLIDNILDYVAIQELDEKEQFSLLQRLLDNTIGLSNDELKRICL